MPQVSNLKQIFSMFQKEDRFLGVDIGASSIKAVELQKEKERAILKTYGEISLSAYGPEGGMGEVGRSIVVVDKKLKEALTDLKKEAKITSKKVSLSIPLKHSFLTAVRMPRMSDRELKDSIQYEARKYIPVPLSQVIVDWWVFPPSRKQESETSLGSGTRQFVDVFLAAVTRDVIEKYNGIFAEANLEISDFEIECFAFARSTVTRDLGTILLVDIGAQNTKFLMVDGGVVRFAHNIDNGAQDLTLALSQSMGVNFERAEILKREFGLIHRPEAEGIAQIIEPLVDFIMMEGERFLLDWEKRGGDTISRIIVGGGGGVLRNINDAFIKRFGVEVETADPFSKVVYPAFLEHSLAEIGPTFINAIGLALKNF